MKKIILIVAVVLTDTCYFVSAKETPPPIAGESPCTQADKPEDNNGYCCKYYDENDKESYRCVEPGTVTKDCCR